MTTGLSEFYKHNLWANLRLIQACSQLSDEQLDYSMDGVYGTIRETLVHMLTSEEGYARRFSFTGDKLTPPLNEFTVFPGFDELTRRAQHSGKELLSMAEQTNIEDVLMLDDGTYPAKVSIVLLQAINHGVDHRSQIATMMSMQGIEPPVLDAWSYNDDIYLS